MRFADPTNDIAFKRIFGNEKHKNILISFLNAVLDFKGKYEIVDITLANPYQVPKIKELKETILDIHATNRNGDKFIVEMQKRNIGDFAKRSLYYTSKAYVAQLPKSKDYSVLKKVYFIGILNFNMFENKSFISRHLIINQETQTQDLKDFEFTFIELPKFKKELHELDTILDKWIYFLKYASDLEMIPKEYSSIEEFREAFELATQVAWNEKELEVYEYVSLKEFDEINAIRTAKKLAREEGLKEGREKGLQEGREKGLQEGLKEGEKKAKIEVAKKLISQNIDIDIIVQSTGLSKDEIERLKESYENS